MSASQSTVEEVLSAISDSGSCRIGIDGLDGVGKSTLAHVVAEHFAWPHIELDSYLEKNKGAFVEYIDISRVNDALSALRFVVEGVCLLDVLSRADQELDFFIYVKRFHLYHWADEDYLGLNQDLEEYLEKEHATYAKFAGLDEPENGLGLSEEIIRYHHRFRPHEKANLTYVRHDR